MLREYPAPGLVFEFLAPSMMKRALPLLLLALTGCSKSYIPNTDVLDSEDNRAVITFCEQYRRAVEDKNVPLLLKMASDRYYEDGGDTVAENDVDFAGLKDYLGTTFQKAAAIRYEVRYRRVSESARRDIYVDYTYSASYRIPTLSPSGATDEWRHAVADNRIVLTRVGDSFKILSGM